MRQRIRQMSRQVLVGILTLLLLCVGGAAYAVKAHLSSSPATDTTTTVAVATSTLRQTVATTGTVAPSQRADLSFPAAGKVTAVNVAPGDSVTSGEVLASMDATDLNNAVALARANVNAATAQLSAANSGGNSASIASAQAQLNASNARLSSAQLALTQANLTSPFAGVVAAVNVTAGTAVSGPSATAVAGGSSGSGSAGSGSGSASSASSTVAITVITTNNWVINASVGSADLPSLTKGMQAEITPTGGGAKDFGTVSSVGVVATTSGSTSGGGAAGGAGAGSGAAGAVASFPITIAVTGSPTGLYDGGTVNVTLIVKQITDALTVPTAAVSSQNGTTVVQLSRDGQSVTTPVNVGMVSGGLTQITKGLSAGDQVLVTIRARTPGAGATSGATGRAGGAGGAGGGAGYGGGSGGAGGYGGQGGAGFGGRTAGQGGAQSGAGQ